MIAEYRQMVEMIISNGMKKKKKGEKNLEKSFL